MTAMIAPNLIIQSDVDLRRKLFGDAVMSHPAKQSLQQLYHLLDRFAVPGITLRTYGHITPKMRDMANDELESLLPYILDVSVASLSDILHTNTHTLSPIEGEAE